jgi:F-type H+-transporting ATPase subunit c
MRILQYVFMTMAALLLATPAFAQSAGVSPFAPIGAGIGMGIASGLCGIGQGIGQGKAAEAVARNPGAHSKIFLYLILGLVLIESLALYTFAIIFLFVK